MNNEYMSYMFMDRLATLLVTRSGRSGGGMAGQIEAARAQRNCCDRDNFRMCVIRSHLGHLDRFASAPMPAYMRRLTFYTFTFHHIERVPTFCIIIGHCCLDIDGVPSRTVTPMQFKRL